MLRETVGDSAEGDPDAEFEVVWREVEEAFAELHLPFGRAAFGGWDDGDPALARATWLVIRALRPKIVVETGVGRGVTAPVILQALARNRHGHLWSIDVAPLLRRELADQTAAIVPELYSKSWTFVRGSSSQPARRSQSQSSASLTSFFTTASIPGAISSSSGRPSFHVCAGLARCLQMTSTAMPASRNSLEPIRR